MNKKSFLLLFCLSAAFLLHAAGTLVPASSGLSPAEIVSHDVEVTINNGFARTEVTQQFRNINASIMEATYSFPVPKSASLSECQVMIGEKSMTGEVIPKDEAHKVYEEEKSAGNNAAIADKDGYQDFTFKIANIQPQEIATISFVYYQPLPLDTETCRYVYPLEEGNTKDTAAESFWTRNSKPTGHTSIRVKLRSAWPLAAWRAPYGQATATTEDLANGEADLTFELSDGLTRDFVFYYTLVENLPGRLEVVPYKESEKDGYFMMVLTPGVDLQPITQGSDYIFVLDVSGSMWGSKLATLANGVKQTIGKMNSKDRFRIVTFESSAHDLTNGYLDATPANISRATELLDRLAPGGSTNLYAGLYMALSKLDDDRVSSLVIVTDGVTNTGEIAPAKFADLMHKHDIRVFGFLMGNNSNWPLMRTICNASGGFYDAVSNDDDIIGKILLAKSKITYQAMHDVKIEIDGIKTYDVTNQAIKKLYRGQQLVLFGRYQGDGKATVKMKTRISGEDKEYKCSMVFPKEDGDNPELERMWALAQLEMHEDLYNSGAEAESEHKDIQRNIGVQYQIVTDETSMIVLDDDTHAKHNIDRRNQSRTAREHAAQSIRNAAPVKSYRVDTPDPSCQSQPAQETSSYTQSTPEQHHSHSSPMFHFSAPSLGGGGGAMSPWTVVTMFALLLGAAGIGNHKRK